MKGDPGVSGVLEVREKVRSQLLRGGSAGPGAAPDWLSGEASGRGGVRGDPGGSGGGCRDV